MVVSEARFTVCLELHVGSLLGSRDSVLVLASIIASNNRYLTIESRHRFNTRGTIWLKKKEAIMN